MTHYNYQLSPSRARSRLVRYKRTPSGQSREDSTSESSGSEPLLIGLVAGEYLFFNKSLNLRVIHGVAQIAGHAYPVMDSYRKFIVPPWNPSERILSLCYKSKHKGAKEGVSSDEVCFKCQEVLTDLCGGTCCKFVSKYKSDRSRVMKHFGIDESDIPVHYPKYSEYVEYYLSQMKGEFDTIIMLSDYSSCFGTVSVSDALNPIAPPRLISSQIPDICSHLLSLTLSASHPVLMLHGDKGSGKSTLITYIVNYLLNFISDVWLLDVDVGQPVVSAPGLITLTCFSQSITCSSHSLIRDVKPTLSLLAGDVKVNNSLLLLRHVKKCYDMYESMQRNFKCPLLINTFGWTSGIGGQVIEAVGSITKAEMLLKFVTLPKMHQIVNLNTHEDLKYYLRHLDLEDSSQFQHPPESYEVDTFPLFGQVVEELGGAMPWNKTGKEYYLSSFLNYANLFRNCNFSNICGFSHFEHLTGRRDLASPADLRWLRFCVYLNDSFADALHFPQLRHEEFFGNVETYNFMQNVKFAEKFHPPRQLKLSAGSYIFVTQSDVLPTTHQELVPMINGTIVGLCIGKGNEPFRSRVSDQWTFVSYAYVHYLNPADLTMVVSYPGSRSPAEITSTNIVVMCLCYAFEPCPGKMSALNSYPSTSTPQLEHMASQVYPFRRNDLLHMVGGFGAGTSAPTQRANLKRFRTDHNPNS